MNTHLPAALLVLLTSLSGCAKDYSLAPPADSEQVTVRIKVPPELEAEKMEVMYRSTICTFTDHTANGEPYPRDGYQSMDLQLQRLGQSDIYKAKLARDGGGYCKWRLSNATFGVKYREPEQFGEGVISGAGGGVVVIFDHNNSPRGGADIQVEGDLTIQRDYYPWLKENFIGGYRKRISLRGGGGIYLKYRALNAREVYFEPILHSRYVVRTTGPKVKKEGSYGVITYPDGSVQLDARSDPSFRKLEAIRMAAEKQK